MHEEGGLRCCSWLLGHLHQMHRLHNTGYYVLLRPNSTSATYVPVCRQARQCDTCTLGGATCPSLMSPCPVRCCSSLPVTHGVSPAAHGMFPDSIPGAACCAAGAICRDIDYSCKSWRRKSYCDPQDAWVDGSNRSIRDVVCPKACDNCPGKKGEMEWNTKDESLAARSTLQERKKGRIIHSNLTF